jgi:hypothetical protein
LEDARASQQAAKADTTMRKKKSKREQAESASEDEDDIATAQRESEPSTSGDVSGLSQHLELQRTRMICGPEMNYHVRVRHLSPDTLCACVRFDLIHLTQI